VHPSDGRSFGGAILATLGLLLVVRLAYIGIYEPRNLTRPAYILKGLVMLHPSGGAPLPAEPLPRWDRVLPEADLQAGRRLSRQCIGCHDLSPAMQNGVGPALRGVVGRPRASVAGFAYSAPMRAEHSPWTPDALFEFLRDPQLAVPGTRMGTVGFPDAQQRIDLIAYLRAGGE
jgi:cytochrome c